MQQLIVRVTRDQHRAMKRLAKAKKTTIVSLVRAWIERVTRPA